MAHLCGGAGCYDEALGFFANALAEKDPAARNLCFELSQAPLVTGGSRPILQRAVEHLRRIGFERSYDASDGPRPPEITPKEQFDRPAENVALWAR